LYLQLLGGFICFSFFIFIFRPEKWDGSTANQVRSAQFKFFRGATPIRLDLMPAESDPATSSAEKRFFALQIDVNQQGCIKFHDGRRFTTLRIQVPLHGAGPVLAAPEDVDWEIWEAEGGLLGFAQDDEEDTDLSAVEEWNKKVCKSEMWTSAGGTS